VNDRVDELTAGRDVDCVHEETIDFCLAHGDLGIDDEGHA